jgi:hypothetical protein
MPLEIVDQHADPQGDGNADPKEGARGQEFEITVNGKVERFDLTNPEHQDELRRRAQFGTNYSQKVEALNRERAQLHNDLRPIVEFDEVLKTNPELQGIVRAALRGDPLPTAKPATRNGRNGVDPGDDDTDDTYAVADVERRVLNRVEKTEQGLGRLLQRVDQRLQSFEEREAERSDEASLKRNPQLRTWITDDHIAQARERRRQHGGSLQDNFKILYFDEIQKITERRVTSEIPAELRRSMLSRDTGPIVVDGMRLTPEKLQELYENPDDYAKVRRAIRAAKRKSKGLLPYPGRE